jgi:hypothetical protein
MVNPAGLESAVATAVRFPATPAVWVKVGKVPPIVEVSVY